MKNKKLLISVLLTILFFGAGINGNLSSVQESQKPKVITKVKYDKSEVKKSEQLPDENAELSDEIQELKTRIKDYKKALKKLGKASLTDLPRLEKNNTNLASLNYNGEDAITMNNNNPPFIKSDLSTANGAWQSYGDLDNLSRATSANVLLNISLMPKAKREPLHVNPTGWHNKRISGGWLYNRCHLISYQPTDRNNNWKNLITGTRQLNDPDMLKYENEVTGYIKESSNHFIRYRVTPIFRGSELPVRGVQMEVQSTGENTTRFNVYTFNVQPDYNLNYNDGTSSAV